MNAKDKDGNTLAHWALKNNKLELVKYLAPKIDVKIADNSGQTLAKIAKYPIQTI